MLFGTKRQAKLTGLEQLKQEGADRRMAELTQAVSEAISDALAKTDILEGGARVVIINHLEVTINSANGGGATIVTSNAKGGTAQSGVSETYGR